MTDDTGANLDAVYGARGAAEIARVYDTWAEGYEREMAGVGYRHPQICLALLARHLPRGAEPILDAGAGTGLVGEGLAILGYPRAEALDISPGMLRVARTKGVYSALHEADLAGPLPFDDNRFAAVVSAGVFTTGHVGVEALDELLRVTRPGGVVVLSVKDTLWTDGFGERVAALEAAGRLEVRDETSPYVSMPGQAGTSPGRGVVLAKASPPEGV